MELYLQHPDRYYPNTDNIISAIKWHIALMELITKKRVEKNPEPDRPIVSMSEVRIDDEIRNLLKRDESYFYMLGYEKVALIETAMLLGRELWELKKSGYSDYLNDIETIGLGPLDEWAREFNVPLTEKEGGDIAKAIQYTTSKFSGYLQTYLDVYEGSSHL